jgi:hypothetical protein
LKVRYKQIQKKGYSHERALPIEQNQKLLLFFAAVYIECVFLAK